MKNKKIETMPANTDQPCACCGRFERKLKNIDGFWLGKNCQDAYYLYSFDKDPKSLTWRGYQQKYNRVARMVGAIK